MNWQRLIANLIVSGVLLCATAVFALIELGTVDQAECNRETFEYICSDYEGMYGVVSGITFLIWVLLTWAINRVRNEYR